MCCWPSPEEAENKPEVFPSALKALQPPNKNTIIREDGLGPHPGFGLVQSSFPALVAAPLLCFPAAVPNSPTGSIPTNSVTSLNLQANPPQIPQLTFPSAHFPACPGHLQQGTHQWTHLQPARHCQHHGCRFLFKEKRKKNVISPLILACWCGHCDQAMPGVLQKGLTLSCQKGLSGQSRD